MPDCGVYDEKNHDSHESESKLVATVQSTWEVDSKSTGDTLKLRVGISRWGQAYTYRTLYQILVQQGEGEKRAVCSGSAWVTTAGEAPTERCYTEAEGTLAGGQVHDGWPGGGVRSVDAARPEGKGIQKSADTGWMQLR